MRELAARPHERDLNGVPPIDMQNSIAENVALRVAEEVRNAGTLADGIRPEKVTAWRGRSHSVISRP